MSPTVSMTLDATRTGSTASFEALYRATVGEIHAYMASLLRDRAAAEDATALAFEKAFRRRSSFDARRGSERAWLFTIARNVALDELRRRRRRADLLVDVADPATEQLAADDVDETRRAAVRSALDGLDARDRELIALKFHAGLSNVELAKVLGISPSNAATRLHRAVTRLREACHAPS